MQKIAFFDIDGTLTSEIDGSIPQSAITAIRKARANGNLMFLNTGRCIQNVEPRFQEVGFDGFVCGCGTDIYCGDAAVNFRGRLCEMPMCESPKAAKRSFRRIFDLVPERIFCGHGDIYTTF